MHGQNHIKSYRTLFSNVTVLVVFSRDSVTNVDAHFWITRVRSSELI